MRFSNWSFATFLQFSSCIVYIDRAVVDSNPKFVSMEVNFTHDDEGNSITNVTFTSLINVTKLLVYFKLKLAEDENDKDFKRLLVSSVLDIEKVFSGKQSNGIINRYFDALKQSADPRFKVPLPMVSRHNFKFKTFENRRTV